MIGNYQQIKEELTQKGYEVSASLLTSLLINNDLTTDDILKHADSFDKSDVSIYLHYLCKAVLYKEHRKEMHELANAVHTKLSDVLCYPVVNLTSCDVKLLIKLVAQHYKKLAVWRAGVPEINKVIHAGWALVGTALVENQPVLIFSEYPF